MDNYAKNRREQRLSYRCLVWFGDDITHALFSGLMEDVSSGGIAFLCAVGEGPLQEGQRLTIRFSLPQFDNEDAQATIGITRTGHIRRVTPTEAGTCRVGLQFDTPLSLKPAEEAALAAFCRNRQP